MSNGASPNDRRTILYQELCTSYHTFEDFRTKLLGFLPLASGAGIFFLLNNISSVKSYLLPIGFVGLVVTFGLFVHNIRALQLRHALETTGQEIETSLGALGQFNTRPHSLGHIVNDLGASILIYFAVMAGWAFFGLAPVALLPALIVSGIIMAIGIIAIIVIYRRSPGTIAQFLHREEQALQNPPENV